MNQIVEFLLIVVGVVIGQILIRIYFYLKMRKNQEKPSNQKKDDALGLEMGLFYIGLIFIGLIIVGIGHRYIGEVIIAIFIADFIFRYILNKRSLFFSEKE